MQHKWTKDDDIVGLYLYLYGDSALDKSLEQISESLGMGLSSLKMKISNYRSIAEGRGLDHASAQSVEVYNNYHNVNKVDLTNYVNKVIK